MTNVEVLAQQLADTLTEEERAELLERLLSSPTVRDRPLSPRAAGIVCTAAMGAVSASIRRQPTMEDFNQLGEALFYGLDGLNGTLEEIASLADGEPGHGPSGVWLRAAYDALNLRDHVGRAVQDAYVWGESYPSYVD